MKDKLEEIRSWAKGKIASGRELPSAWYQYVKLIETVDALLVIETVDALLADEGSSGTERSQRLHSHRETHLQLVDSRYQRGASQRRPNRPLILVPAQAKPVQKET